MWQLKYCKKYWDRHWNLNMPGDILSYNYAFSSTHERSSRSTFDPDANFGLFCPSATDTRRLGPTQTNVDLMAWTVSAYLVRLKVENITVYRLSENLWIVSLCFFLFTLLVTLFTSFAPNRPAITPRIKPEVRQIRIQSLFKVHLRFWPASYSRPNRWEFLRTRQNEDTSWRQHYWSEQVSQSVDSFCHARATS